MTKVYIDLENLLEGIKKQALMGKVKKNRVSYKLRRAGRMLYYCLTYTPVYVIDPKTKKRKYRKLSAHQKICNLIMNHNITCFADHYGTFYLHLKKDDLIAPLWSDKTRDYFLSRGVNCKPNTLNKTLLDLECLCTRILKGCTAENTFDSETLLQGGYDE